MDEEQRLHLREQLRTLQRRLRVLERQQARLGTLVPAHIELEIEDVQAEIGELEVALTLEGEATAIPNAPAPPSRRADYYAHITLPPNYVPRTEVLVAIRTTLLAGTSPVALTSAVTVAKPTALHGMGGIGKSVIARALCDDPAVQSAFPDGILWATIGQAPDRIGSLRTWIQALGGAVSESAPTIDSLKGNLARLLGNRACLLVVDDIWKRADVETFQVGGSQCRLLITTRDEAIAEDLGAKIQRIPVLNRDEAIALLDEWSDGQLVAVDLLLKERIVARLGCLPLAVKLAGAQLRRKQATAWLQTFDVRRLASRRPEDIHDSLELTFGLSLDTLRPSDRRLYTALAIFKEDEAISESGIARLWQGLDGLERDETSELLDDLAARALLELSRSEQHRAVRLHDLLREFIAAELNDVLRTQTHQALIDTYRTTQTGAGWHTAPDDGYLYDHLSFHLEAVDAQAELRKLFADQEWMQVRVAQRAYTYDGYLEDLDRTWAGAERQIGHHLAIKHLPYDVIDLVRCALIRTSINSIAANYPASLVARALELGQWSAQRALSIATNVPDPAKKTEVYIALLNTSKLDVKARQIAQQRGWEALWNIQGDKLRMELLALLVPHLEESLIEQALGFVLKTTAVPTRIQVLRVMGSRLNAKQLERALQTELQITDQWRYGALSELTPWLSEAQVAYALERSLALKPVRRQGPAIVALAPRLSGGLLERALDAVLKIDNIAHQGLAFAALAPQLSGALLDRAIDAAMALEGSARGGRPAGWLRAYVLSALVPQLSAEDRQPILDIVLDSALGIKEEQPRAQILRALAPHVHDLDVDRLFDAVLRFERAMERARVFAALAPRLGEAQMLQAIDDTMAMSNMLERASIIKALAPYLSRDRLNQVLATTILPPVKTIIERPVGITGKPSFVQIDALETLAPYLDGALLELVLEQVLQIETAELRARMLRALAPQLTETLQARVLAAITVSENISIGTRVLDALAPRLNDRQLAYALQFALLIPDGRAQANALAILSHTTPDERLTFTFDLVLVNQVVAALSLPDPVEQDQALIALSPQVASALKSIRVLPGVAIQAQSGGSDRVVAEQLLLEMLPFLPDEPLQLALHKLAKSGEIRRAQALIAIAPRLSTAQAAWGLKIALTIKDEHRRADTLRALAPQLKDESLAQALEAALALQHGREPVLLAFLPVLSGQSAQFVLRDLAGASEEWRIRALIALAPRLTPDQAEHALNMVLSSTDTQLRLESLVAFAAASANNASVLRRCAQELYIHMRGMKARHRRDLLTFCATPDLFSIAIFPEGTARSVAQQIEEICDTWQWM